MTEDDAIAALSSLSNSTRLRMLRHLVAAGPEGLSAGEIATEVGATPSRASFHLSKMTEARLIRSQRQSRQITFLVDFDAVGGLIRYLIEDCCKNNPTVRSCCAPPLSD